MNKEIAPENITPEDKKLEDSTKASTLSAKDKSEELETKAQPGNEFIKKNKNEFDEKGERKDILIAKTITKWLQRNFSKNKEKWDISKEEWDISEEEWDICEKELPISEKKEDNIEWKRVESSKDLHTRCQEFILKKLEERRNKNHTKCNFEVEVEKRVIVSSGYIPSTSGADKYSKFDFYVGEPYNTAIEVNLGHLQNEIHKDILKVLIDQNAMQLIVIGTSIKPIEQEDEINMYSGSALAVWNTPATQAYLAVHKKFADKRNPLLIYFEKKYVSDPIEIAGPIY